jgi:hypothetical protein
MKISAHVTGRGQIDPALLHLTVVVQFDAPSETMQIAVIILDQHDDRKNQMAALARAKELVRLFDNLSL